MTPTPGRRRFAVPSAAGYLPVVLWAESRSLLGVLAAGLLAGLLPAPVTRPRRVKAAGRSW